VREVLGEKIISGESAVWVLLESGDTGKDAAVEEALRRFATKASATLEIPDGVISQRDIASGEVDPNRDPIDMEDILRSKVPLKIAFSSMRLGRDEAPEAFFRQMLLGISGHENAAEPLVFATFGRGRVMPPIPASKLTETSFLQAASYLCGACSCGVKEDNPGIDLVMNVAWDEHLEGNLIYAEKALPPLTGAIGAGRDSVGEAGVGPVSDPGDMSPVTRNMLVLFALMGGALVVGSLVLRRSS
jgi:hypothetical protein